MIDLEKQVAYWRDGAVEDWQVAVELVNLGRTRHGLFFAHLALKKLLKAHLCRATADLAPQDSYSSAPGRANKPGFQRRATYFHGTLRPLSS